MQNKPAYQDRIVVNPAILAGKPVVKGTRIPVDLVLERLEEDTDTTALFEDYPQLRNEDIKACLWLFVILQKWLFVNLSEPTCLKPQKQHFNLGIGMLYFFLEPFRLS